MKKIFYILVSGRLIRSIICGEVTYVIARLQSEEESYNDSTLKEIPDTLYENVVHSLGNYSKTSSDSRKLLTLNWRQFIKDSRNFLEFY